MFSSDLQNTISSAHSTLSIYLANANNMTSLSLGVDLSICIEKYLDLTFSTSCVSISSLISSILLLTALLLGGITLSALSSFSRTVLRNAVVNGLIKSSPVV